MEDNLTVIWDKFLNDDIEAYAIIYNKFIDTLYRYGIKINPDEESVKDAIQETFIDLYLNRKNNKTNPSNLKYYLILSLKRNLIKKLKKGRTVISKDISDKDIFETEYSIEHELIQQEKSNEANHRVHEALSKLTTKQKEIVYLRFNESMEYDEIARVLKITIESARKQVWRALKSIRESIGNESINLFITFFNKIYSKNLSI